jgi:hypothetical protein
MAQIYQTTVWLITLVVDKILRDKVDDGTKQERREKKQQKKRDKILQHGRSLVRVYKDAILKRAKRISKKEG